MHDFHDSYARDGYIFPLDVISPDEAAILRADYEAAESMLAGDDQKMWLLRLNSLFHTYSILRILLNCSC